jgi:sugar O-acyltransferase (sialic acid O-acetyltransferase NeuD family)
MILYGGSGHAKVVIDCVTSRKVMVEGVFDDFSSLPSLNNVPILGKYEEGILPDEKIIISIGDNLLRRKIVAKVNHQFGTAIHQSALLSSFSRVGEGSVVMHGAIIQAGVNIGAHCIINTRASIDHDCIVEDFVHISPGATLCGTVKVGEGSHIGAGATVIPNVKIGKWAVIGAGAVITQDVPDFVVVVGVPGRIVKRLDPHLYE